jgi:outer membrane protein
MVLGLVAAGLLLTLVVATAGFAAVPIPAGTVGMVDTGRIGQEYKVMQKLGEDYQAFQKEQSDKLQLRTKTRMLNEAEQREYLDLAQLAAPTEDNKKRITALDALVSTREQRRTDLDGNKSRTPAEQKEYDDLNKLRQARTDELNKLQSDAHQLIMDTQKKLQKLVTDGVDSAIKAVAEQKKLTLVLPKDAVLFGGTNITDEVLAKLNAMPIPNTGLPAAKPAKPEK